MQEVVSLVLRARGGDEDAFADIVEMYTPMLQSVAHKYALDFDEVFSELCMALYRAVGSFDVEQSGVTFGLYAQICAGRAMSDAAKQHRRDTDARLDSDVEAIAEDVDVAGELIRREENEAFRRDARGLLSEYEYTVLLRWLGGDKTADIADLLGVSAKSVDNAKARILKKLRDGLRPIGK